MITKRDNGGLCPVYPFTGIPTFLRMREVRDEQELQNVDFDIAVLGVPFDEGIPFMPGARFGARSIREQSLRFSKDGFYSFDENKIYLTKELQENRIVDMGDVSIVPCDTDGNIRNTTAAVRKILGKLSAGNRPLLVSLGGDHSVSYPLVQGFDALGEKIHVVHFDAHSDYLGIEPGFEYTNTHPCRQIAKMDHVASLTQVGIRSSRDLSVLECIKDGNRVIGMKEFHKIGPQGVADAMPAGASCYVSIDIDALDCSLIPGCVSAEPDGLKFAELADTLAALAKRCRIVGFDLVEIAPQLDVPTQITSFLGCNLIVGFLGHICDQPYWKARYK